MDKLQVTALTFQLSHHRDVYRQSIVAIRMARLTRSERLECVSSVNGATRLGRVSANQPKAPSTTIHQGTTIPWQTLGNFTISGGTLNVVLNNNANGNVQADMVRLVPISPTGVAAMVTSRDVRQRSVDAVIASHYFNNDDRANNSTLLDRLDRHTLRDLLRARRGR